MNIEFKNVSVTKRFTDEKGNSTSMQALTDVSFTAESSRVFAVMGPSGSGKSTLLRLINRLEDPVSGEIIVNGINVNTIPILELRRKIGFVFQLPLMFEGNVRDNLLFGPLLSGRKPEEIDQKIVEYLPWFGFEKNMLERHPAKLSVGERQRICILRALMNEPEVLLMDEPTASLDPCSAERILNLIKKINKNEKMTIILITHIPEHAREVAHRGLVLMQGKTVADDNIENLINSVKNWVFFKKQPDDDSEIQYNRTGENMVKD
jgi:putative ABC transport system ATP-binding protein